MTFNLFLIFLAGILSPLLPIPLTIIGILLAMEGNHTYLNVFYLFVYVLFVDFVSFFYNFIYIKYNLYSYLKNNFILRFFNLNLSSKKNNLIKLLSEKIYKNNILIKMVLSRMLLPFTLFYTLFVLYRNSVNYLYIVISSIVGLTPRILIISGLVNITLEFVKTSSINYTLCIIIAVLIMIMYLIKKILTNK
jgi:hypothetical protein